MNNLIKLSLIFTFFACSNADLSESAMDDKAQQGNISTFQVEELPIEPTLPNQANLLAVDDNVLHFMDYNAPSSVQQLNLQTGIIQNNLGLTGTEETMINLTKSGQHYIAFFQNKIMVLDAQMQTVITIENAEEIEVEEYIFTPFINLATKPVFNGNNNTLYFFANLLEDTNDKYPFEFAILAYNQIEGLNFIPIELPSVYQPEKNYGALFSPFTAGSSEALQWIFPLSKLLYTLNFSTNKISSTTLNFEANFTKTLAEAPNNNPYEPYYENSYERIINFTVAGNTSYLTLINAYSEKLPSKVFTDNVRIVSLHENRVVSTFLAEPIKAIRFNLLNSNNQDLYAVRYNEEGVKQVVKLVL
jgi:hypothetical protein